MLSLIVPCYNEEESLPIFYREVTSVARRMEDRPNCLDRADSFQRDQHETMSGRIKRMLKNEIRQM